MDFSTPATSSLLGLDEPICPYTGLRTFTEEEAIYFRGREAHVANCLALVAERRFVMITGASGDGKSSLVFAGMVPEVRAGFVRARHGNWTVATFRPERSPLRNLAQALAPALRLPSASAVESELAHGFSALVQLYQTSELSPAAEPPAGLGAAELRQRLRQAANLLVVVDQFEEFFTNPENYDDGVPNTASQTVVNLLLETTRLAEAENLPIYIVCTMRSDFVGQCAEFRGLIEQVGTSNYFVPRLQRHEFVEVIRDPALLSGNRISERLVQRLLYDIGQGQDQLPVLQHALRRIWLAADEGREEMDLLHYAMVGGLSDELPADDQARFAQWRAALPAHQWRFLLAGPALSNVLDAHANQLYFEANDLYNRDFQPALPPGTAERVIEQTFRMLTRTDGKRVVRRRLTGAQITAILQDEALPWPVVCRILRPFRAAGTTFLSPFLGEDEDDRAVLPADTVLDITHESLIRNWKHLAEWASAEANDVRTAQNLVQQASRWQENGESKGFLLSIGLYTFFTQWYRTKRNAASWLTYYLESHPDDVLRSEPGVAPHDQLLRYLQASRRRLWSQLLAARYGAWRLTAAVLLPVLLLAVGHWAWTQRRQQSDYVATELVQSGLDELASGTARMAQDRATATAQLRRGQADLRNPALTPQQRAQATERVASSQKALTASAKSALPLRDRAVFLLTADRLKADVYRPWFGGWTAATNDFRSRLTALHDDTLALDIELNMLAGVNNLDYDSVELENPYIQRILLDVVPRLARADSTATRPAAAGAAPSEVQRRLAVLTARTVMALAYYLACDGQVRAGQRPDPAPHAQVRQGLERSRQQLLRKLRGYVQREIQTTAGAAPSPVAFGFCLRVLLGQGTDGPADLAFLNGLNPFGEATRPQFDRLCAGAGPATGLVNQRADVAVVLNEKKNNGAFLTAALAFAALRDSGRVAQCLREMRSTPSPLASMLQNYADGVALLPYLVKYELFTAENAPQWLAACAQASRMPFEEVYAATVYSLLSRKPVPAVFDVSQPATTQAAYSYQRLGGVDPQFLNADRVSFALPPATRDKTWRALQGATPVIAATQAIFIERSAPGRATSTPQRSKRNELFLQAFLAKTHGVYLHELKKKPFAAAQEFAAFGACLRQLRQHLQRAPAAGTPQINAFWWNLNAPEDFYMTAVAQVSAGAQNPITWLQLPTRPKTRAFEAYYTCSFDAFFLYELGVATAPAAPDRALVQLLDSLAFREAALPDHFSNLPTFELTDLSERPAQYRPNLVWIRAVARANVPGNVRRRQRNGLLLILETARQTPALLGDSAAVRKLTRKVLALARRGGARADEPAYFAQEPLQVAFSDLAAAVARRGWVAQAFALTDSVAALYRYEARRFVTPTKIRICEQAMLAEKPAAVPLLTDFLAKYLREEGAGVVVKEQKADFTEADALALPSVAASVLTVCYWLPHPANPTAGMARFWRPQAPDQTDTIALLAPSLTYRLSGQELVTGLFAPFKAYGLSDQLYKAQGEMMTSAFRSNFTLFRDINCILLGYAHRQTKQPGWREYDEAMLTQPADYAGK